MAEEGDVETGNAEPTIEPLIVIDSSGSSSPEFQDQTYQKVDIDLNINKWC